MSTDADSPGRFLRDEISPPPAPFGQVAMELGIVTLHQLEEALRAQEGNRREGNPCLLGETLQNLGYLDAEKVALVLDEQRRRVSAATTGATPTAGGLQPGTRVGTYEIVREIGRGGMGVVFQAYHGDLRRTVALKVIRENLLQAEPLERFHREAIVLARLRHPGIVTLYETGSWSGHHYAVMEHVQGGSLADWIAKGRLDLEPAARIVAQAARAAHHAHQQGVIHRDLKPANLLLDVDGNPRVADFGLAHLESERLELTRSGVALGTPAYMAPEQVEGRSKEIGPATDVYSLGATLYEAVTGAPPFTDTTIAALFHKVSRVDPTPPSRRRFPFPRELEAIIQKAMEKEPPRRYATAAELADDLERWLRREPIIARPIGALRRLARRARRHPWAVGVGIAGILGIAVAVGLLLPPLLRKGRRLEEREARLTEAQQEIVARMREISAVNLEAALMARRAGDLKAMEKFARRLEEVCGEVIRKLPHLAEPHYHLGRIYRVLMRYEPALEQQENALRKEADYAPALYERALLLSYRFRGLDATARARLASSGVGEGGMGVRMVTLRELEERVPELKRLGERIRADIARLRALAGVDPAMADCAEGVFLLHLHRYDEAGIRLRKALLANPGLVEAYDALVEALGNRGRYAEAIGVSLEGTKFDRGYYPLILLRGGLRLNWGNRETDEGRDPAKQFEALLSDCRDVLALRPGHAEALWLRACARLNRGHFGASRGMDPSREYEVAITDLDLALGGNGRLIDPLLVRALVRINLGEYRFQRGNDPDDLPTRATADCDAALAIDSGSSEALYLRAMARVNLGFARSQRGGDPSKLYVAAVADCDAAKRKSEKVRHIRALALINHGNFAAERGRDPSDFFRRVISESGEGPGLRLARATARCAWGYYLARRGKDPTELYRRAIEDCTAAARLPAHTAEALRRRALTRINCGLYVDKVPSRAVPFYRAAVDDAGLALKSNPRSATAYLLRAMARLNWGTHRKNPRYDAVIRDCGAALRINPAMAEAYFIRALAWNNLGARAQDPRREYEQAVRDFTATLTRKPTHVDALLWRARVYYHLARAHGKPRKDAHRLFQKALDDCDAAMKVSRGSTDALVLKALIQAGRRGN